MSVKWRHLHLVVEGVTESGSSVYDEEEGLYQDQNNGVLQILLQKIFEQENEELSFSHTSLTGISLAYLPKVPNVNRSALKGNAGKVMVALLGQDPEESSGCVILSDTDNGRNSLEQLKEGVELTRQQFPEYLDFKVVCGVAKEMLEAWLLADKHAYEKAFGEIRPELPENKKPEELYGPVRDPESNYPKHVLKRILREYNRNSTVETRRDLAEEIDIETLRRHCPVGFGAFYDAIYKVFFPWAKRE